MSKRYFIPYFLLLLTLTSSAQQVPQTVVAEHFTNTYCSICASRNPALYSNLANYPQVLHIAYYPSAPYAACPLNMHNTVENDARTNFYGVYGSTPQLLVQGSLVTAAYTDTAIFTSRLNKTTSFSVVASIVRAGSDSVTVNIIIRKTDTSSLSFLLLYGMVVEDTLFFAANNGETKHYNVFRKALWGTDPLIISAPVAIGDSALYTKTVAADMVWDMHRIYAAAILQQTDKIVMQAARSSRLPWNMGQQIPTRMTHITLYPNPASDKLFFDGSDYYSTALIMDAGGKVVKTFSIIDNNNPINIASLPTGLYLLKLNGRYGGAIGKFVKK